jgi:hypothetical protein
MHLGMDLGRRISFQLVCHGVCYPLFYRGGWNSFTEWIAIAALVANTTRFCSILLFVSALLFVRPSIFFPNPLTDIPRAVLKPDSIHFTTRQKPDCSAICQSDLAQIYNDARVTRSRAEESL